MLYLIVGSVCWRWLNCLIVRMFFEKETQMPRSHSPSSAGTVLVQETRTTTTSRRRKLPKCWGLILQKCFSGYTVAVGLYVFPKLFDTVSHLNDAELLHRLSLCVTQSFSVGMSHLVDINDLYRWGGSITGSSVGDHVG